MLSMLIGASVMCASCAIDEIGSARSQQLRPEVTISQQLADGCSRFALRVVNGMALVEALYNTNGCQTDDLRLELDSAAVYDAVAGTLRVPVVIRNIGTHPVIAPTRVRFVADSTQFLNGQGQVIPGTPNIVATNYDTANVNGRSGQWRYDAALAGAGQTQVLLPNGVSGRRWLEFAGSDLTARIRIKLPTLGTVAPPVPAVAPDTIPLGFYDDSNFVVAPTLSPRPIVRDVVAAWFKTGASQAQRAAAIASVGGNVVGGARVRGVGDGAYLIRLVPDSTHLNIATALASLRANSAVAMAVFLEFLPGPTNYRKPSDGQSWGAADYTMRADSALAPRPWRANWALDAVDAPLAWGCSVGSDSLRIGVVDVGLHVQGVTDLLENLGDTNRTGILPIADQHGTHVASVLGARGNNGVGIAGAIWRSRLSLRDVSLLRNGQPVRTSTGKPSAMNVDVVNGISASLFAGDRIINLSLGIDTLATGVASAALRVSYAQLAAAVIGAVRNYSTTADTSLMVVSGGNNPNADPLFSYFTVIADSLPDHTLIVSAARRSAGVALYPHPVGSRIAPDLAAPGEAVGSLGQTGFVAATGSSFAVPLAAGVAGLVLSFDPRLSVRQARALVMQGAVQGGRTSGGVPLLNAYESLRAAANTPAAPLCGNRLWIANRQVHIQRGAGEEVIPLTLPSDSTWNLEVAHGGRRINYETEAGEGSILWTPSGWVAGPATPVPAPDRGGTHRSLRLQSHNGDSLLTILVAQSSSSVDIEVTLAGNGGLTPLRTAQLTLPGLAAPPLPGWPENEWVHVAGAYPQNGGEALLAVNRMRATNTFWYSECPNGPSVTCQPGTPFAQYYWRPKQVDLYRLNVTSAPMTATHLATIPDTVIYDIALSEDGREKLLRVGRDSIYDDPQAGVYSAQLLLCQQTWSRPTFGGTSTTTPFDSSHARFSKSVFGCRADPNAWYRQGLGTSAPRLAPGSSRHPRTP